MNKSKTAGLASWVSFCGVALLSAVATVIVGGCLIGCGAFLSSDGGKTSTAEPPPAPAAEASATAADQDATAAQTTVATANAEADASPSCVKTITRNIPMTGLGVYVSFAATDKNNHHTENICNMLEGYCLGRFTLQAAEANALRMMRVIGMKITLTRTVTHAACDNGDCTTDTFVVPTGTVFVHSVRSDYDPSMVSYNKRTNTSSWDWGQDRSQVVVGQSVIASNDSTTNVDLDPTQWTDQLISKGVPAQANEMIAVQTSFSDPNMAAAPYVLVVGAGADVTPAMPPVLHFTYCQ